MKFLQGDVEKVRSRWPTGAKRCNLYAKSVAQVPRLGCIDLLTWQKVIH
jgi:hypothetical protein